MSDFKSKMPDMGEITTMATKLFKDVKSSVGEIVEMYKQKRSTESSAEPSVQESKPKKTEKAPEGEHTTTEKKEEE